MKKVILIDGNNFMFRAFFATSYTGNIMRNSEGFPTNALYGFINMLNKIIDEEKPEFMVVAFDVGKNFRKEEYSFYKEGRSATPEELKVQMPYARKVLDGMGIKYLEMEPYEADDIIGTLVKMASFDKDFDSTIVSSDKDLLQLINYETDVKLLKKDSYIRYDEKTFKEEYGIDPIKMIDLKALMGDASDNIPGVKGIGEKTALKLLHEYESLEGVYENINNIKGANKTKLENDKENAFMSKKIATIFQDVPININFEDLKYKGNNNYLKELYMELGFNSLLKRLGENTETIKFEYKKINNINELLLEEEVSLYVEYDNDNYHNSNIKSIAVSDKNATYIIDNSLYSDLKEILKSKEVTTYDIKKHLKFFDIKFINDLMIGYFLLGMNVKDDISSIMFDLGINVQNSNGLKKNKYEINDLENSTALKAKFIFDNRLKMKMDLNEKQLLKLYNDIELPLSFVLSKMENNGIVCKKEVLDNLKINIKEKIDNVTKEIYIDANEEFNISSPKQLGEILFEKMNLAKGKKNKTGYKTDASVLEKMIDFHPIISKILLYRNLTKIYSTYIEGLEEYISENGKIHPIFKQTLARTGRLSCTEPNLQNIPVREELGKQIRKAFLPENDLLLSADYSQIELRILAHISGDETLIESFNKNADIHKKVAADIHGINENEVTKEQRKTAKAVIFGIVYGISGFGLGGNLNISKKEADMFINKYYELYPKVKKYMNDIVSEAKNTGEVKTLFDRIRIIEEIKSSNFLVRQMGERMALNTPMQGTSADIIKIAMINIQNKIEEKKFKSKLILQVHDELIFDVTLEEKDIISKLVKEEMENVIKLSVPLKVEINVAENWYEV